MICLPLNYYIYREIFARVLFYAPFALVASGRISDWANTYVSNYLSLFTTLYGRIQDETKPFVSWKGWKQHGAKIFLYTVLFIREIIHKFSIWLFYYIFTYKEINTATKFARTIEPFWIEFIVAQFSRISRMSLIIHEFRAHPPITYVHVRKT